MFKDIKIDTRSSGMKCSVSSCSNTLRNKNCRWFKFPKQNEDLRNLWISKCKLNVENNKRMYICEVHFEQKNLSTKYLGERVYEVDMSMK